MVVWWRAALRTYVSVSLQSHLYPWSSVRCEEAGDPPYTGCLVETPMVSRSNMVIESISPGEILFKWYMTERVIQYALVAMQLLWWKNDYF